MPRSKSKKIVYFDLETLRQLLDHAAEHEEEDHRMFGFIVFLLSESIIFFSFFVGYTVFKTGAADWLPAGVYTYSYTARATNLGTFQLPPIHAEEMYAPERFGHSSSSVVKIVE